MIKIYTALVTGASRGIGLAIAGKFKKTGYKVIVPTRGEMDLLSNTSIDNYLRKLKQPIDILVNDAGINPLNDAVNITDEDIETTLQVNLIAPIRICRAIIPGMIKQQYGRIVNLSSIWSIVTKPKRLVYSASKSGLSAATRTMAVELSRYNIMVNAVAPGFTDTEMTRKNNSQKVIAEIEKLIPIGRLARPSEIAEVVAFLASENNTYLTGQTIFVDGGYTST